MRLRASARRELIALTMETPSMPPETNTIPPGTAAMVLPELWRSLGMGERPLASLEAHGDATGHRSTPAEPLEALVALGARAGLAVLPRRMRVSDAVWIARGFVGREVSAAVRPSLRPPSSDSPCTQPAPANRTWQGSAH